MHGLSPSFGFCVREFAYILIDIYNPKINTHRTFVAILGYCALCGGKHLKE